MRCLSVILLSLTTIDVLNKPLAIAVAKLELPPARFDTHHLAANLLDVSDETRTGGVGIRSCDSDLALIEFELLFVHAREGSAQRFFVDCRPDGFRFFNIQIHERGEVAAQHVLNGARVRHDDWWNR